MARARIEFAAMLADPVEELRRARRVGWLTDNELGGVGVVSYEHTRDLLTDARLKPGFVDFMHLCGVTSGPFYEWMAISPLNRDGADHVRWRQLMAKVFTPRNVERLRPFLQTAAHELIDGFAARGAVEFMAEFADVYPSLGLSELIGVPAEDRERFRAWANTIGLGFNPLTMGPRIAEIDEALNKLLSYTGALAAKRRRAPQDDLVTRIARAADEEGGWTPFEVQGFIAGLVFAGHETTKNQLGWMVALLAEQPAVWDAVGQGTLGTAEVVEEVMRLRGAATNVGRTVAEPVQVGDETLRPGDRVLFSLWSANRDEGVYPKPDAFDPRANAEPHVAFGHGPHFCLGAALARAELQEALGVLAARLTCPVVDAGAQWSPPMGINGPTVLPIRFAPRSS